MFQLIQPFIMLMSVSTATGVLMHDTHLDKAAVTAMYQQSSSASTSTVTHHEIAPKSPVPELHAHAERGSLSQAVRDMKASNPRVQPRNHEDKKHLLQKRVAKGHHPFDSYNLPLM